MIGDRSEPELASGSDGFGVFLARSRACDSARARRTSALAVSCSSASALVWWMLAGCRACTPEYINRGEAEPK